MPEYRDLTEFPGVTIMDRCFPHPDHPPPAPKPAVEPDLMDEEGNVYENIDDVPCACIQGCGCPRDPGTDCCCTCWRH